MLQVSNGPPPVTPSATVERVRKVATALGCADVWVRVTGPYILLGLRGGDAFARLTALGGASYGLAFRAGGHADAKDVFKNGGGTWDPVLLIDDLVDVVEHALVGVSAVPISA
ncbi:MAG TPA: hypothetical protein VK762_13105 [Polyangiaceae bacterium]|jgi:hypothetical protein|nr:hypothetical protein [Polyangiaceae bacterium]